MIFDPYTGRMMETIDLTASKAVDITALEICDFTHIVHGGS